MVDRCHQLRIKADKERVGNQVFLRRDVLSVDVNRIAERLKGVKADSHRQRVVEQRQQQPVLGERREIFHKEIVVFKKEEYREVREDRPGQHPAAQLVFPLFLKKGHQQRGEIGDEDRKTDQKDVFGLPAHIEIKAGGQKKQVAHPFGQKEEKDGYNREKEDEIN